MMRFFLQEPWRLGEIQDSEARIVRLVRLCATEIYLFCLAGAGETRKGSGRQGKEDLPEDVWLSCACEYISENVRFSSTYEDVPENVRLILRTNVIHSDGKVPFVQFETVPRFFSFHSGTFSVSSEMKFFPSL